MLISWFDLVIAILVIVLLLKLIRSV